PAQSQGIVTIIFHHKEQKMKRRGWFLLSALCLIAADAPAEEAVKKELANFQGDWKLVSAERDGKPDESFKGYHSIIKGNQLTGKQGDMTMTSTIKIDPTRTPKTIDVTLVDGPDKGKTRLGIYEFVDK